MRKSAFSSKNSSPPVAVRRPLPSKTLILRAAASLLRAATYGLRASLAVNQDGGGSVPVRRWLTTHRTSAAR